MSKLVLNGDTSGSVTLDAPAVSGTTTLTLPTTSGTIVASNTSGNVGIGTSSPSSAIEVARGTGSTAYLSLRGNNNSIANELVVGQGSDGSAFVYQRANSAIQFGTNNTTRMIIDANGNLLFNSGYGSAATAYGCRAWIKFDGTTATPTINGNGNVSSITDNGTGDYTLNFTTAMPDTNYNLVMSMSHAAARLLWTNGFTTTTARVVCANTSQVQQDGIISVAVFR